MTDKGFENLRELVKDIGKDIRNLYNMALELQDRVSALEEAAEQADEADVTVDHGQ